MQSFKLFEPTEPPANTKDRKPRRSIAESLNSAIAFVKTPAATLLFLVAALLAQTPHSATVFHRVSTSPDLVLISWVHAYAFAISVEAAVLMFVIRREVSRAWMFAGFSFAINIVYYWQSEWIANLGASSPNMAGALLSSVMLPLAIALYSHSVSDESTVKAGQDAVAKPAAKQDAKPAQAPAAKPAAKKERKLAKNERLALLREHGITDYNEAASETGVSYDTARRDVLQILAEDAAPTNGGSHA